MYKTEVLCVFSCTFSLKKLQICGFVTILKKQCDNLVLIYICILYISSVAITLRLGSNLC